MFADRFSRSLDGESSAHPTGRACEDFTPTPTLFLKREGE